MANPNLHGVYFYSTIMSLMVVGKSGKRYHFQKNDKTAPVIDSRDIQYFRTHPQLREEGADGPMASHAQDRTRPKSYTQVKQRAKEFPPPSEEQLEAAKRRRAEYEKSQKAKASAVSGAALAETGVGTPEAQAVRKRNAKVSAGEIDAKVEMPSKAPEPAVEAKPEPAPTPTPEFEVKTAKTDKAPQDGAANSDACRFCGKEFPNNHKGARMHERRWCKKNPNSPEYDPDA